MLPWPAFTAEPAVQQSLHQYLGTSRECWDFALSWTVTAESQLWLRLHKRACSSSFSSGNRSRECRKQVTWAHPLMATRVAHMHIQVDYFIGEELVCTLNIGRPSWLKILQLKQVHMFCHRHTEINKYRLSTLGSDSKDNGVGPELLNCAT